MRGSEEEKKNYLDYLTNEPERANTILSNKELETSGYKKLNTEDYANGWYGRNDDPKKILDNALDESPDGEFIFSISSQNPFETSFDLWAKKGTYRDHVDVVAERDIDMHEREFGADGVRAIGSKEDRDEFRSEKEKFNNRYGESKEIEEEPVEDDMKIGDDKEEDKEKILNELEGKEEVKEIEEVEEENMVDDEPHRTVADALKIYGDDGCDVGDNEMDYMWFMNYEENPTDYYDRVQNYIAENTYVEREDEDYVLGRFYDFCDKNLDKFAKFMEENCIVMVRGKNKDDDIEKCIRVIEDLCIGNYSEGQYKEFLDIFASNNSITEDAEDDVKKIKRNKSWKSFMTYDGKKIDRVLSSTETDSEGHEYPVAKLFFGKAPDSVVLTGDEAEKYIDHWEQYADDPDKYKEYADKQGRYVRIHEDGEKCE